MSAFFKATGSIWGIIVTEWAVLIYLIVNYFLPGKVSADLFLYVYQPILWSSLAILAWLGWRFGLASRPKLGLPLAVTASLVAFFQIAVLIIAGLFLGFGYSPYDHRLIGILRNLLYLVTLLAALELMRAFLVARFKQHHPLVSFILVSFFLAILRISPATYGQFNSIQSSIQFIGERLLPLLTQNMLATLLALLGGPLASMGYLGILQLFEWLSPILPNLGWFTTAIIGTVLPAFGMVILYNQFIAEPGEHELSEARKKGSFFPWAVVAVFSLLLVGFSTGLFGVHPSLIGSGSMSPSLIVGDIVLTQYVPLQDIRVGDVIGFREYGQTVIHRVVKIMNDADQVTLITQGDANNMPDPPVTSSNYQGKVVFYIPKIGWVSIFIRNTLAGILR
jgi:signal peptidase